MEYIKSLFNLPISTLDMLPPGQTAAIITITANNLQVGLSERVGQIFSSITLIVAGLYISFSYSFLLTLATTTGLLCIGAVYSLTTPLITSRSASLQEADIKASGLATEAFSSFKMVAACGAETKLIGRYSKHLDNGSCHGRMYALTIAIQQGLSKTPYISNIPVFLVLTERSIFYYLRVRPLVERLAPVVK
jgi:ATP-binding cassette, subfamily B (MDR/TAP), member 1